MTPCMLPAELLLLCPMQAFFNFLSVCTSRVSTAPSHALKRMCTSCAVIPNSIVCVRIVVEEVGGQMVVTTEALHQAADTKVASRRSIPGAYTTACHSRSIAVDTGYRACICVYNIVIVVRGEIDWEVRIICRTLRSALSRHEYCRRRTARGVSRERSRAYNFDIVKIHGWCWAAWEAGTSQACCGWSCLRQWHEQGIVVCFFHFHLWHEEIFPEWHRLDSVYVVCLRCTLCWLVLLFLFI
jgi:hypothetical protein